ncbi:hypothetical protein NH26_01115 [Flammeovirga pacifica]|uniref:Multiple inositol polyphosphate phosphatase 1 n=1 Tax=Flammeovirga pacifica TaxID=915059 RepID=A0A1S1YVI9_FLAPC|nr:hypothetical protein NH26_01115 [Flammeovirga pacifica]
MIGLLISCGHTTNVNDEIDTYDEWELGKNQPYNFKSVTSLPEGYNLDFVGYLSRHSSRYMTKPKEDVVLYNLFENAKLNNGLKKNGKHLFEEIKLLLKVQRDNYGTLSSNGEEEHKLLGQRMANLAPEFFNSNPKIKSTSTLISKTQDSRANFQEGISSKVNRPKFINITYDDYNDPILRAFKISPSYQSYIDSANWQIYIDEYQNTAQYKELRDQILDKLFTESYIKLLEDKKKKFYDMEHNLIIANKNDIVNNLFKCFKISHNLPEGFGPNLEIFTAEDSKILSHVDNIKSYYTKGPGFKNSDISYKHAITFLKYMHSNINSYIDGRSDYQGNFNFAHSTTVVPVLVLLNLDQYKEMEMEQWNESEMSKMATNLTWLVLEKEGEKFIQIRWNENPVQLPLKEINEHYLYSYEEYDAYISKILSVYGLKDSRSNYNDILLSL